MKKQLLFGILTICAMHVFGENPLTPSTQPLHEMTHTMIPIMQITNIDTISLYIQTIQISKGKLLTPVPKEIKPNDTLKLEITPGMMYVFPLGTGEKSFPFIYLGNKAGQLINGKKVVISAGSKLNLDRNGINTKTVSTQAPTTNATT
jgi:hypothetical protein